jgi:hypothetical protein
MRTSNELFTFGLPPCFTQGLSSCYYSGMKIPCACGCGTKIEDRDSRNRPRKYVSGHNNSRQIGKIELQCPVCDSKFNRYPSVVKQRIEAGNQITCSNKCRAELAKVATQTDKYRQKMREISLNNGNKPPTHSGKIHWNWKGGIAKSNVRYINQAEYSAWRKAVLRRDAFTCQTCGQVGGKLEAHHIKHWASHPEYRFDVDNGLTLCKKCHYDEHH